MSRRCASPALRMFFKRCKWHFPDRSYPESNTILLMRSVVLALIVCLSLPGPSFGDAKTSRSEQKNRKKAEKEYVAAIDCIRSGDLAKARELLDNALELDPANFQAITARELLRQNEIHQTLKAATQSLESKQDDQAIAAFRQALL